MQKNKLFILTGPSGVGKTTLCERLSKDFPTLIRSVTFTTRFPRPQEKNGIDYHFISIQEFQEKIRRQEWMEWKKVYGHYYGNAKESIYYIWNQHHSVLLVLDVQGALQLKKAYSKDCICFFIQPPHLEALENRLRLRGTDSDDTLQIRIQTAKNELYDAHHFDFIMINENLDETYRELKSKVASLC